MSEKRTYTLPYICNNCGHKGRRTFPRGKPARGYLESCDHCGCDGLRFGEVEPFIYNAMEAKP